MFSTKQMLFFRANSYLDVLSTQEITSTKRIEIDKRNSRFFQGKQNLFGFTVVLQMNIII